MKRNSGDENAVEAVNILKDEFRCDEMDRLESALEAAKGLVFDCDGTLLDTMPIYFESWSRACDELGLSFPVERFYAFAGAPVEDIFQTLIDEQLANSAAKPTVKHCEQVKRRHHQAIEKEGLVAGPIDVVVELVHRLHGTMPMAVASSGWRDHVIEGLERVGILHMFDQIVTADDDHVKNPKPSPDIFLVAAQRIGVPPERCVGFEDADFGMQALSAARYHYACDVRKMHMYPRNVERRESSLSEGGVQDAKEAN